MPSSTFRSEEQQLFRTYLPEWQKLKLEGNDRPHVRGDVKPMSKLVQDAVGAFYLQFPKRNSFQQDQNQWTLTAEEHQQLPQVGTMISCLSSFPNGVLENQDERIAEDWNDDPDLLPSGEAQTKTSPGAACAELEELLDDVIKLLPQSSRSGFVCICGLASPSPTDLFALRSKPNA